MGNKSSTSTSTRSTTDSLKTVSVKEHIKLYNKQQNTNAYVVLDPESNIKKLVPKIYDIKHSSILERRRKIQKKIQKTSSELEEVYTLYQIGKVSTKLNQYRSERRNIDPEMSPDSPACKPESPPSLDLTRCDSEFSVYSEEDTLTMKDIKFLMPLS